MIKNTFPLLVLVLLSWTACEKNEILEEEFPHREIFEVPGHQFFMRGTLDGEPIAFEHFNRDTIHVPDDVVRFGGAVPYLDAEFKMVEEGYLDPYPLTSVHLRFTWANFTPLIDILQVGSIPWHRVGTPITTEGAAYIYELERKDKFYKGTDNPDNNSFNEFTITNVELLDVGASDLLPEYQGKLYKVEGHFKTILYENFFTPTERDSVELVIDAFSVMLLDNP
ncbi:MAG: hypothetical protein AAF990_07735 [Bacteroidota bacterium]